MNLNSLGWDSIFEANFSEYKQQGLIPARVARENRQLYIIYSEHGELDAENAGRLYYLADSPADLASVGDWVAVVPLLSERKAIIQAVLPRKNKFSRLAAGTRTDEQIVASNVDISFIVTGMDSDFNIRRIERYLTLAVESQTDPVIILNKSDVCDRIEDRLEAVNSVSQGHPVHAISAKTGSGITELRSYFKTRNTAVLLGSSGAGKSTIINRLLGYDRQFVNSTRESDGRGQHTTTFRELILLPEGGMIIDNPGMRELKMWNSEESVSENFMDIEQLALQCRFRDCSHRTEPGCAVLKSVEDGTLDSGRLENYRKLQKEARFLERRQNHKLRLVERALSKQVRGFYRDSEKRKN